VKAIDPICGMPIETETAAFSADIRGETYYFCSEQHMHTFLNGSWIAYFSMEVGLKSNIPTYSGGLGVLAGDTIRSSADLRIPLVAVTLVSRKGYLKQRITDEGEQQGYPDEWRPEEYTRLLPETVTVQIEGRDVIVQAWYHDHWSLSGGLVPVLFLDTDHDGNERADRRITDVLYGGDSRYRLKQAIVLGIGGVKMLDALKFRITKYHMNEGYSSLLTLELLRRNGFDADRTRETCVFTTHTPVSAAFATYAYDDALSALTFPADELRRYGGQDRLNLTLLALNLSKYVNGVGKTHREYSRKLFPGYYIRGITNGVHPYTWACPPFREVFDRYIPGWANEPELLVRVDKIPHDVIQDAHIMAKRALIDEINEQNGAGLDLGTLTIGFARRMTAYKRAVLLFSDLERLREIADQKPLQLVFSGKAHPEDAGGRELIREIHRYRAELAGEIEVVYLPNYSMDLAGRLTSGVDLWLNTPLPPFEASGTSGMKAAINGVVNFSVLDGWWREGCIEGVTGWAIGPDPGEPMSERERREREIRDLYSKLEYVIGPLFYGMKDTWTDLMKNSVGKVAYYFNSHVMMRRYATEAYL